jgi:hypothetical protein
MKLFLLVHSQLNSSASETTMNMNKTRSWLRVTTAIVAICTVSPMYAEGQKVWGSIEVGRSDAVGESYNSYYNIETAVQSGAVELGVHLKDSPYSISAGIRRSNGSDHYEDEYGYSYDDVISTTTLDFEVGRDVDLGANSTSRLTFGVRNVRIEASSEYNGYYDSSTQGTFQGTGPRIAFETSQPITNKLSLDVEAGLAVLFGSTHNDHISYYGYPYSGDSDRTVQNLDFSAALSYLISPTSKVSLGVRADKFIGLGMYDSTGYYEVDSITTKGAFLKFTKQF